jgi:hypothetical protein
MFELARSDSFVVDDPANRNQTFPYGFPLGAGYRPNP